MAETGDGWQNFYARTPRHYLRFPSFWVRFAQVRAALHTVIQSETAPVPAVRILLDKSHTLAVEAPAKK